MPRTTLQALQRARLHVPTARASDTNDLRTWKPAGVREKWSITFSRSFFIFFDFASS